MIEINLVPDIKQELIKTQRMRLMVISTSSFIGIASVIIVILLAFYVFAVQSIRNNVVDGQITAGNKTLSEVKDLSKMLTIQNQLTKIPNINSSKKIDSRSFELLKKIIPPTPNDIQVSKFTVNSIDKTVSIEGQAYNSYAAVEVFKKTVGGAAVKYTDSDGESHQDILASDIIVSDASYGKDSSGIKVLRFNLSFNYVEELFSPESKNVSISITNNGNATDSYLGVPNSVFTQRANDLKEGE